MSSFTTLNSQPVRHLGMGTPGKNPIGKGTALETVLMCSKQFEVKICVFTSAWASQSRTPLVRAQLWKQF
jgi:hypothetical protein